MRPSDGPSNIPLPQLRERVDELPRDRTIDVACAVGQRAYYAVRFLAQREYRAANLSGGWQTYRAMRAAGLLPCHT